MPPKGDRREIVQRASPFSVRPSRYCGGFVYAFLFIFAFGVGSLCGRGGLVLPFTWSSASYSDESAKMTLF